MTETLLPCPFCGSDRLQLVKGDFRSWVTCVDCQADGPFMLTDEAVFRWNEVSRCAPDFNKKQKTSA